LLLQLSDHRVTKLLPFETLSSVRSDFCTTIDVPFMRRNVVPYAILIILLLFEFQAICRG
jgi:hypothetical protein